MTSTDPIGVGVIGLGFMGRTHLGAYEKARAAGFANRLVAVCDQDPERRAGRPGGMGNAPRYDERREGDQVGGIWNESGHESEPRAGP